MVGVIACAGKSSRLFPSTMVLSKQLLPLYDKPLIYYPISMLLNAGIKDIAIITNKDNYELYQKQLKNIIDLNINLKFYLDENPMGTIASFKVAKNFTKGQKVCYVLGDNFFYGQQFEKELKKAVKLESGAVCFGYPVKDPRAFGVASFNKQKMVTKLVEKPKHPESNIVVTGIYVYDEKCTEYSQKVEMSSRGEYEVTDLNNMYLKDGELKLVVLKKSNYWLDAGTSETLLKASNFVCKTIKKTKKQIACLEEIAYKNGLINKQQLKEQYDILKKTSYGQYLEKYL